MALYFLELMLFLFSIIPGHHSRYRDNELKTRQIEMKDVCNGDKKVELNIQSRSTSAIILNFSGRTASSEFRCHLELEVDSNSYGIGVFFEEMNLEGRWPSQCGGGDHVQFGRDNIFGVTTHSSSKFCGRVEAPVSKSQEPGVHKGLSFPQTKLTDKNRMYIESHDREMDVWMTVKRGRIPKNLTLVVTPFKKSCSDYDLSWTKCTKYSRESFCINKDLFCDGRVNCPVRETEATDENAVDCEALHAKTQEGPKFALVIIVLALISIMVFIIYILARKFRVCNKPGSLSEAQVQPSPSRATTRTRDSPEQGRNSSPETIPMSGLPLNPPPYSEVVGYPQDELDDPPKYSDIMSHSKTIVGQ